MVEELGMPGEGHKKPEPRMKMNFSRAMAIIKSHCPKKWARAHAKAVPITRERHGLPGVYVQVMMLLHDVEDWDDGYGAVTFLREWVVRHREEAEHGAQTRRRGDNDSATDRRGEVSC